MRLIEWAQFILGVSMLLAGVGIFVIQLFGVFKFEYVLNRMHAAAMGDTLGIGISLTGLIILSGISFTSLKMMLVIVFLWLASPVSSHLIARLEVTTNEHLQELCKLPFAEDENSVADEICKNQSSVRNNGVKEKSNGSKVPCEETVSVQNKTANKKVNTSKELCKSKVGVQNKVAQNKAAKKEGNTLPEAGGTVQKKKTEARKIPVGGKKEKHKKRASEGEEKTC